MKVLACSTLALASLSLAVPKGRRGNWKRRNNGPQLRPMINDPLSSVEEFFSAEEIAAAASGSQSYKCKSPKYMNRCRIFTIGSFKYTYDADENRCDSFNWSNRPYLNCNALNTDNYFDTREECENSCLAKAAVEENETEASNIDSAGLDDTAGLTVDELLNMPVNAKSVFGSSSRFADLINQYKQSLRRQQKSADTSKCDAPIAKMSMCRAFFSMIWTFNKETGECDSFNPGGCEEPTENWFTTEADCRSTCIEK